MKRNILSLLLFVLTSVFIVSCSDSGDDSGSSAPVDPNSPATPIDPNIPTELPSAPAESTTEIDLNSPDTLVGTYDITFFATEVDASILGKFPITNDCNKISTDFSTMPQCENIEEEQVTMTGEGTITKNESGDFVVITKVQMAGGAFANNYLVSMNASSDVYNYTVYTPIPVAEINSTGVNFNKTIKGTTGRNLTKATGNAGDEYKFTLQPDGTLLNEMTKQTGVPISPTAEVRVIMKKKNNTAVVLNPNTAYPQPAISGFQPTVQ